MEVSGVQVSVAMLYDANPLPVSPSVQYTMPVDAISEHIEVRGGLRKAVAHVGYRIWRGGAPWPRRAAWRAARRRSRRCRRWNRRRWAGASAAGHIDLHRGGRGRASVSTYRYRCVTHIGSSRERALLVQGRTVGPAVGSRIIHLQGVGGIRIEHPLQPCSYSRAARGRHCLRAGERIATAEDPQLARDHCRARHVGATGHIGPCRPRIGRNVVVIQRVEVRISEVTPTGYVYVPVDNARTWSSQRGRHAHPAGVKGVGYRVILPYLPKGRIHIAGGITAYQVNLA